ncbi:MAG: hypothetical protein ACI35O_13805 [Bacillaceae bacterium]
MGKSKRFIQQSTDAVTKHAEKFPYHLTLAQSEALKGRTTTKGLQHY